MNVIDINHIQVNVPLGALEAAREFYVGFLGLKPVARPTVFQSEGIWLHAGSLEVHIGLEDHPHRHETRAHIAFEVTNLPGWRQKIDARGWEIIEQPKIAGFGRFHFRDPFGNNIELISREAV